MGRPCKSTKLRTGHQTSGERDVRSAVEGAFLDGKKPTAPKELTKEQKRIFNFIVKALPEKLLCSLDVYIVTMAAVSISRVQEVEFALNRIGTSREKAEDVTTVKNLLKMRDSYTKDFFRCCNELCLSPQSRAKIGSAASLAPSANNDPLTEVLRKFGGG